MRAWVAERFGKPLEVLVMKDVPVPVVEPGHVLVKVETATVNKNEVDGIYGKYASMPTPPPFVPGFEILGRVEQAGAGTEDWLGKRVIGMPKGGCGGYAAYALVPTVMTFEVPDDMPAAQASGILWPFHLAWLCLFTRAKLAAGETALIHSGAGGVGSAAVQLAKQAGARVIATAGSDEKLQLCRSLGADVVVNYRSPDLIKHILDAAPGKVDVAFDGIGGDVTEQTWKTLGYGARHIIMGFSSGIEQEDNRPVLLREMIFGNFSLVGVLMTYVEDKKSLSETSDVSGVNYPKVNFNMPPRSLGLEIHRQVLGLFAAGKIRSVIGLEVGFDELPAAIDRFDRSETAGRVVIHIG